MSLQTSKHFDERLFDGRFVSSWITLVPLVMNSILLVGLFAIVYRRWEHFPGYFILLSAGLVLGSLKIWFRLWKEHQVMRALSDVRSPASAESWDAMRGQLFRSAATLFHLSTFYWVMCALLTVLAIDHATR